MRPNQWAVLGIILVAIGGLGFLVSTVNLVEESRTERFEGVTRVVFELDNSPIDFSGGGTDVVVDMSATTGFMGGEANVEVDDETLVISHECPTLLSFGCRASFDVTLPSGVEVSGSTSNGPISLTALDGPVRVTTSNGPITLEAVSSDTSLRTSNGPITGTDITTPRIDATTSNGRITLEFAQAPASVEATSSNGTIEVWVPEDAPPYAMSTSTSNGNVETDIRTDPQAEDSIEIRTSNGNITVGYRP